MSASEPLVLPPPTDPTESRRWLNLALSRIAMEEVVIDDTTTNPGSTFKKGFTTYRIKIIRPAELGGETTVDRRYSEFEAIWSAMERRYSSAGMIVPPLPTKDTNMTPDVKRRMRGLGIALAAVCRNPFLRYNSLVVNFLNPDGGENSDKSFVADEKSDGRWEEFLPTLPATLDELKEDELEKKCSSLLDETTKVGKSLEGFLKSLDKQQAALATLAAAQSDFEASAKQWSETEAAALSMNDATGWPAPLLACGAAPPPQHTAAQVCAAQLPLVGTLIATTQQSRDTLKCLQIWPLEYANELNKTLRGMLSNGAELKKKAAAKWQAFYKIQAKPVKPNAPVQEKTEVETAKEVATEAQLEWTKFVKVLFLVGVPNMVVERSILCRDQAASLAVTSRLAGASAVVCANHFFSHLEAAGATLGCPDSNGWNLASVTASSDQALTNAKEEVKLSTFAPSEDETDAIITPVPALDSPPPPKVTAVAAAPPPVPKPPAAAPVAAVPPPVPPPPAAAAAAPVAAAVPPPVPAPPAAAAAAAAPTPSATDSLFGDVPDGPPAATGGGGAAKSEIDALLSGASGANKSNDLFGDEAGV